MSELKEYIGNCAPSEECDDTIGNGRLGDPSIAELNPIFFIDFTKETLTAQIAAGAAAPTLFIVSRGVNNPATYVDHTGLVITVLTSNTPRFAGGFYDALGFHPYRGLLKEPAGQNDAADSGSTNPWTPIGVTRFFNEGTAPDGVPNSLDRVATQAPDSSLGQVFVVTPGEMYNFSFFGKRGTMDKSKYAVYAGAGTTVPIVPPTEYTLTKGFCRHNIRIDVPAGVTEVDVRVIDGTEGHDIGDFHLWGFQFESVGGYGYPSSYIPTTTGHLTRNSEILLYSAANNFLKTTGSIIISFTPTNSPSDDIRDEQIFINIQVSASNSYDLLLDPATDTLQARSVEGGVPYIVSLQPSTMVKDVPQVVGATFSNVAVPEVKTALQYQGAQKDTNASFEPMIGTPASMALFPKNIGGAIIKNLIIFDIWKSEADMYEVYQALL